MRTLLSALLAVSLVTACTGTSSGKAPSSEPSTKRPVSLSCSSAIQTSPLPEWAREGFSPPDQPARHVIGVGGNILGVVFASPLKAPPVEGQGNKILWVPHPNRGGGVAPLKIHATLNDSDLAVTRVVAEGPGPSIIDMPRAGCWTFSISWADLHDRLAIPYLS